MNGLGRPQGSAAVGRELIWVFLRITSSSDSLPASPMRGPAHDPGPAARYDMIGWSASRVRAAGDDAALIEASVTEPEQFAALFDRHAPVIHRYVARRAGTQLADDLTAETFLIAFRDRQRYDASYRDARPWLYGIATHLVSRYWHEETRQLRIRQAAIPDLDLPGHDEQVAADTTARSLRGALAAALAELPPGDRDVLVLVASEQLTYEETATALAIPVGTVRSRLHRARASLRRSLAANGRSESIEEILFT